MQDDPILPQTQAYDTDGRRVHYLFAQGYYCVFYCFQSAPRRHHDDIARLGLLLVGLAAQLLYGGVSQPCATQQQGLGVRNVSYDVLHNEGELEE